MSWLPPGKDWVDLVSALATPMIAALAAWFAYLAYCLEKKKREDALFDRRYKYWRRFERFWLQTGDGAPPDGDPDVDEFDLRGWCDEAELLFGKEAAEVVAHLPREGHSGGGGYFIEEHIRRVFFDKMKIES